MFFCPIKNRGIESRLKRPAIDLVWFFLSDFCFIRALIHKIVDERVFSSVSLLYRLIQSRWENPPALTRKERTRVQLLCADVSPVLEKLYFNTIIPWKNCSRIQFFQNHAFFCTTGFEMGNLLFENREKAAEHRVLCRRNNDGKE